MGWFDKILAPKCWRCNEPMTFVSEKYDTKKLEGSKDSWNWNPRKKITTYRCCRCGMNQEVE